MSATRRRSTVRRTLCALAICAAGVSVTAGVGPASADPGVTTTDAASIAQTPSATSGADVLALLSDANAALRKLGISPFLNPSVAFNCVAPTESNPLGLLPAAGGAIAGPWSVPGVTLPRFPLVDIDPNVVKDGQTLYGVVPAGVTGGPSATGMQVAWINISTGRSGVASMGEAGRTLTDQWLAKVPAGTIKSAAAAVLGNLVDALAPAGSRLAPVDTGHGTVLSAVFGTIDNGGRSCFFLPMVGIVGG